ncbi:hypothetical protein G4X40_21555 [Rhodococcus sp. D2-41]|uniref:Uncharacterized protein n=1 Tax=Speluncibacter jeojiensis TaxID=2710754 RepID=A0A9X4M220_9ACTN|nr:hypothetical protein [Rhodococcus sp. D2-41]MDG3012729.1 hypothetical protein [Rhodococcus sp. D2-41]MDG3015407.1 hypothetical protein [Corynebacteriales bacterium D3-21]
MSVSSEADPGRLPSILDRVIMGLLIVDGVILAVLAVLFLPLHVGSVPMPVSALVAGVLNVLIILEACRLSDRTWVRALPLIAWTAAFAVCTFGGPGGDVLLPSNWTTPLLLVLGVVPALVVLVRNSVNLAVARGAAGAR